MSLGRGARLVSTALAVGVVTGAVVGGLGSRLVMRVIALGNRSHYGEQTHEQAVVGHITMDGTLNLVAEGAVGGLVGAVIYLLVRLWLPGRGWRKGLAFAVFLLAFGYGVMVDVTDYEFFRYIRPVWAYLLFALLPLGYGLVAATLTERWGSRGEPRAVSRPILVAGRVALSLLVVVNVGELASALRSVGNPLL